MNADLGFSVYLLERLKMSFTILFEEIRRSHETPGIGVRADMYGVNPADSADALRMPPSCAENTWIVS